MRLNTAIIISGVTLSVGFFFDQPYLWIPLSVLVAGVIDLFTRQWYVSDRLGSDRGFSILLKLLVTMIGFYAMLGQAISIGLIIWWFAF